MIGKIMLPVVVLMGFFSVAASVVLALGLYEDWSKCQLLNKVGEVRTVPLLQLEKDSGARNTIYTAIYQLDDSIRKQRITKSQYKQLVTRDKEDILVYENNSMTVGSKPRYDMIVPIMISGAFGGPITGAVVIALFQNSWKRLGFHNKLAVKRKHREEI